MLAKVNDQLSDETVESLPVLAWIFLAMAFAPHLLAVAGLDILALISAIVCFPASMGPFAMAHAHLLAGRLGFTSHMAWISALLFAMIWFVLIYWLWNRNRVAAMAVGASCFVFAATLIFPVISPLP